MSDPTVRPWYRQLWPWLLIVAPAAAVIGGGVTLYLAITRSSSKPMSFAVLPAGGRPFRATFTVGGVLNHTRPWAQAAAMSWSPIPCPKAPMAPRMLACESVETSVRAGSDEAFLDRDVRADAGVDVEHPDSVLAGEQPAGLLIGGVLLVRARRVAVEGEECPRGVGDAEPAVLEVLDDVGAAEVARHSRVDHDVVDLAGFRGLSRVFSDDLLDDMLNSRTPHAAIAFGYAYDPAQNYLSATRSDIVDRAYRQAVTKAMNGRLLGGGIYDFQTYETDFIGKYRGWSLQAEGYYRHQRVRNSNSGTQPFDLSTIPTSPLAVGPPEPRSGVGVVRAGRQIRDPQET